MKPSEHKNTLFSPEKIIEAQNHIMPYSEYIKLGKIKFPDHYFVEGKGKKILFYEAIHSFNPDDMQFQEIPKLLQEFQPEKIFVENQEWVNNSDLFPKRKEYILQTDINTIINEKAESGYVIKISIQNGLSWEDIISPELPHQYLAKYLKEHGYLYDEIFFFYVIRDLGTRRYEDLEFISDDILIKKCNQFANILNISEEGSVELFKKLHKKLLEKDFENNKDHKTYKNFTVPLPNKDGTFGYFNKIANISSKFRDGTILEKIAETLETSDKIMVVYGGSHGVILKPALEYLLHE